MSARVYFVVNSWGVGRLDMEMKLQARGESEAKVGAWRWGCDQEVPSLPLASLQFLLNSPSLVKREA